MLRINPKQQLNKHWAPNLPGAPRFIHGG